MDRIVLLLIVLSCVAHVSIRGQKSLPQTSVIEAAILDDEEARCHNFSVGNPRLQEFYSPGYPGKYPPKSDCILALKAETGHIIRVDFRDQFDVEPHDNCEYDFLEVRDGAHGYSPFLKRFCGRTFPPVITSSDRYLWLRFNTDETIEYSGFRAVYQYIPDIARKRPEGTKCRFDLSGLDGTFSSRDIPEEVLNYTLTYNVPLDCTWVITVDESQKIQLSFPRYALAAPNECDVNFIEIFGDKTDLKHRLRQFCGSVVDYVISKTNVIHVRFFAEPRVIKSNFEALFTAITLYRETEASGKCAPTEFDCEDAVCVDMSLRCNGRINCKFRYDEEKCNVVTKNFFSHHIIIILSIGCIIMFGMCFNWFYKCFRKLRADHSVYQARRSRSREDRLDDVDSAVVTAALKSSQSRLVVQRINMEDFDDGGFEQPRLQTPTTYSNGHVTDKPQAEAVAANGQVASHSEDSFESDDEEGDEEPVEMVDHACQTRESLFGNQDSSADQCKVQLAPPQLPQPPPPSSPFPQQRTALIGARVNPYKAEKVIEISRKAPAAASATSSSAASSKSGPDVLVLH